MPRDSGPIWAIEKERRLAVAAMRLLLDVVRVGCFFAVVILALAWASQNAKIPGAETQEQNPRDVPSWVEGAR
jgi:hypothetical protein